MNRSQQQQQDSLKCHFCNQPHQTFSCQKFTPDARRQIAKTRMLCPICLIPEHQLIDCPSDYKCTNCQANHWVSLCAKSDAFGQQQQQPAKDQSLCPPNTKRSSFQDRTTVTSKKDDSISANVKNEHTTEEGVEATLLNNAQKLIFELTEPMVRLQSNINANIVYIEAEEKQLRTLKLTIEELSKNLYHEVDDLEVKELDEPQTVCTASKCVEVVQYQGNQKLHYKTICHRNCKLPDANSFAIGTILKTCSAMQPSGTTCNNCGCPYEMHMYIKLEYEKVKRTIIDRSTEKEIKSTEADLQKIEQHVKQMRNLVEKYKAEFKVIDDVTSKFADFLTEWLKRSYHKVASVNLDSDSSRGKVNHFQLQQLPSHRTPKCLFCDQPHQTIYCQLFTPNIRQQIAESRNLCPVCLISEHQLIDCPNDYKCTNCQAKHWVSICTDNSILRD